MAHTEGFAGLAFGLLLAVASMAGCGGQTGALAPRTQRLLSRDGAVLVRIEQVTKPIEFYYRSGKCELLFTAVGTGSGVDLCGTLCHLHDDRALRESIESCLGMRAEPVLKIGLHVPAKGTSAMELMMGVRRIAAAAGEAYNPTGKPITITVYIGTGRNPPRAGDRSPGP